MNQESFDIIQAIKDFVEQETVIDWSIICKDQELFELALESLDTIIDNVALYDAIKEENRTMYAGKLSLNRAKLAFSVRQKELYPLFEQAGNSSVATIRELLTTSDIIEKGRKRFQTYEELDTDELENFSPKELTFLRPVFIIIGTYSLLTLDQIQE